MFYHKKQTKQDLQAAKELIVQHGWKQGDRGDIETGFCLLGAIDHHIVVEEHDANAARIHRSRNAVRNVTDNGFDWIWNDTPGRTKEEVLALLDKAIESV